MYYALRIIGFLALVASYALMDIWGLKSWQEMSIVLCVFTYVLLRELADKVKK
jgi:hypothetical protein